MYGIFKLISKSSFFLVVWQFEQVKASGGGGKSAYWISFLDVEESL